MTGEDLVKKVKSLNFPKGKYVVVGSGILGISGLFMTFRIMNFLD